MKTQLSTALSLAFILASCDASPEAGNSQLMRHAKSEDSTVRILRVKDADKISHVLVTQGKGYELVCSDVLKRKSLIQATGYPYEALFDETPVKIDSEAYVALNVAAQPKLDCTPEGKTLYKSDLDGTTKYFFGQGQSTRLYQIGCQALVEAMGFDTRAATPIPTNFIDGLGLFKTDDADDINCLSGVPVGSKISWRSGADEKREVKPGDSIGNIVYSAKKPNGNAALVQVAGKEGTCDWVSVLTVNDAIIISGQVPANFYGKSCDLTITGEKGQIDEDSKILSFSTKPLVCDKGYSLKEVNGVPTCEANLWLYAATNKGLSVSVDYGETWTHKTPANGLTLANLQSVYADGKQIYTVDYNGLSISRDGGETWTSKSLTEIGGTRWLLDVHAQGNAIYVATNNSIGLSFDGGQSWRSITKSSGLPDDGATVIAEWDNKIFAGVYPGVSYSTDRGGSWSNISRSNGLAQENVTGISGSGSFLYVSTFYGGLSISRDGGQTWVTKNTSNGLADNRLRTVYADGSNVYVGTTYVGLLISRDSGETWQQVTTSQGLPSDTVSAVRALGDTIFAATDRGLAISRDGGKTWVKKDSSNGFPGDIFRDVAIGKR